MVVIGEDLGSEITVVLVVGALTPVQIANATVGEPAVPAPEAGEGGFTGDVPAADNTGLPAPPEEWETEKSRRGYVEGRKEACRGVRAEENRVIAAAYDKAATRMREKRLAELTGDTPAAS